MGKRGQTQGTICTMNLLQKVWDQLRRHIGTLMQMCGPINRLTPL